MNKILFTLIAWIIITIIIIFNNINNNIFKKTFTNLSLLLLWLLFLKKVCHIIGYSFLSFIFSGCRFRKNADHVVVYIVVIVPLLAVRVNLLEERRVWAQHMSLSHE